MPRKARLDIPGALHHIMIRGINKTVIFSDDQDRFKFLERLGENIIAGKCFIYAWALMDNHVHLLFKSGKTSISSVMRKQLTWYAQYYNRKNGRSGHLFENRYKSIICDEDKYLLSLVRYIHLNPIRAGKIKTLNELDEYSWSGHKIIVGNKDCNWMETEYVLSQFSNKKNAALKKYRKFMEEGIVKGCEKGLSGGGLIRSAGGWSQVLSMRRKGNQEEADERILGNGEFVSSIIKELENKEKCQLKVRQNKITIDKIINEECVKNKISQGEMVRGSCRKKVVRLRDLIAYRAINELGLTCAEIARHLGVSTSCITRGVQRFEDKTNN